MKRDIDLARQLLLDIEVRGIDCSVSVLRSGPNQEAEDRIRYHLRLLIDAGMLKEIDRTSSGIPCLRLTHDGHEMLELARNENRWREAKSACQERIGGLSLAVIRGILLRWAYQEEYVGRRRARPARYFPVYSYYEGRRPESYCEPQYRPYYYRDRGPLRAEPHRYEPPGDDADPTDQRDWWLDDDRYVRIRPEVSRAEYARSEYVRPEYRDGVRRADVGLDSDGLNGDGRVDGELETTLPDYLI